MAFRVTRQEWARLPLTRIRTSQFYSTNKKPDDPHGEKARILGANTGMIVATQSGLFKLALPLPPKNSPQTAKDTPGSKSITNNEGQAQGVLFLLHKNQPLSHLVELIERETSLGQGGKRVQATFHGPDEGVTPSDNRIQPSKWAKWASSTEIGSFVQDVAKDKKFFIRFDDEQSTPRTLEIRVPTFEERTFYLRQRLRSVSRDMRGLLDLKKECDHLAAKGARRVAYAGLGGFGLYFAGVWYLTFRVGLKRKERKEKKESLAFCTDRIQSKQDRTGLTTIAASYVYFLVRDKEVSYRSVIEVSQQNRREKFYTEKGFDRDTWQDLVEEGSRLRRAIRAIANDYDVKWRLNDEPGPHDDIEEELKGSAERAKSEAKASAKRKGATDKDD